MIRSFLLTPPAGLAACAQTPCDPCRRVSGFIRRMQRSMADRSLCAGGIRGAYDASMHRAVLGYQTPGGLESQTLSMASAKALGRCAA